MSWTPRDSAVLVLSFAAGGAAGALGWQAFGATPITAAQGGGAGGEPGRTGTPADLEAENARLKGRIAELDEALRRQTLAKEEAAKSEATAGAAAPESAPAGAVFTDPRFADALARIDWETMGRNIHAMKPLLAELAEAIANGEAIPLDVAGEVQKLNGDLVKIAGDIAGKLPGAGINGAFTHPLVAANQFAASLHAAGLELTDVQRERLDRITQFYAAKDRSLRDAEAGMDLKIAALLEETELKDGFYREARALLSAEQGDALWAEATQGRTSLDLFDSGVMLAQFARPVPAASSAEFASSLGSRIADRVKLPAAARKQVDAIVSEWASQIPADYWREKAGAREQRGWMKGARVRDALRRQVELMRRITASVELTPAQRQSIAESMAVFVPLPN